jgi:hypothetical protein
MTQAIDTTEEKRVIYGQTNKKKGNDKKYTVKKKSYKRQIKKKKQNLITNDINDK